MFIFWGIRKSWLSIFSKLYTQTLSNLLLHDKAKSIIWKKKLAEEPLPFFWLYLYSFLVVVVGNFVNQAEFWIQMKVFRSWWQILPSHWAVCVEQQSAPGEQGLWSALCTPVFREPSLSLEFSKWAIHICWNSVLVLEDPPTYTVHVHSENVQGQ